MRLTIRPETFETNSSSTHSLIMMSDDEYRAWKNGDAFLSFDTGSFESREQILEYYGAYVSWDGYEWVPKLEENGGGWSEQNWYANSISRSLNECNAADRSSGIWIEDEGELNGVHGVCFYLSND